MELRGLTTGRAEQCEAWEPFCLRFGHMRSRARDFRLCLPQVRTPLQQIRAQSDRHFRLSVEDSGLGVPREFVPDLFERFTRSEVSRRNVIGTGLGLAIARSYARAHGGDLFYEDADPHGARFQLVLPTAR